MKATAEKLCVIDAPPRSMIQMTIHFFNVKRINAGAARVRWLLVVLFRISEGFQSILW